VTPESPAQVHPTRLGTGLQGAQTSSVPRYDIARLTNTACNHAGTLRPLLSRTGWNLSCPNHRPSPGSGKMSIGPTLTEVQLPPKEANAGAFSSGRLLSKITRSPTSSRRHRPVPSQGSDTLSGLVSTDTSQIQAASHSRRNQPRPGFQRQISAPDTSVLRQRKEEDREHRHYSDATGEAGAQVRAMLAKPPLVERALHTSTNTSVSSKGTAQGSMFSAPLVSDYYSPQQVAGGPTAIGYMYQQLYELAQKRIATLQYMSKA